MNSKNKFFMYVFIVMVSICFSFAVSNVYAQGSYSLYPGLTSSYSYSPIGVVPTFGTTFSPINQYPSSIYNPYVSTWGRQISPTIIASQPKTQEKVEAIEVAPVPIQINATEDGELTGEMVVKFHAQNSPYPPCYNYYFDGMRVYRDIKAYITSLVRCTDMKTDAEAIYSFKVGSTGFYKISNLVWAKNCGHDSFHVEIKRGNKRIPFPARNSSGGYFWVKTAHDRYEFNPNNQYNRWHWQDVCHWNAYYPPYERAIPCIYYLRRGVNYKLIYRAREDLTRLAAIRIQRLCSIELPTDIVDLEKSEELNEAIESFKDYFEMESKSFEPSVECDEEIEAQLDSPI
jgi:hypothetical protein